MSETPSSMNIVLLSLTCVGALLVWVLTRGRHRVVRLPYPPGPPIKGLLSGNAGELALQFPWLAYTEWGKKYGDLLHFRAFNQHIVVINSVEVATELLEKRSHVYSSRPFVPMWDLMGFAYSTGVRDYSPEWRKHRRIFQQILRQSAAVGYRPIQREKIRDLLHGLLSTPDNFRAHIKTAAGAIIMSVMYGYDVMPKDDPFVTLSEDSADYFEKGVSLNWLVNSIPALKYVPAWFPGAGFKRYAASVNKIAIDQIEIPFKNAVDKKASGSARLSVVSSLLDQCHSELDLQMLRETSGTGYGAGVNTTGGAVLVFMVAMITNPEIQLKAQRELDSVAGRDRLVDYGDQPSLPYLQAIFREVHRWRPITPLGLPHASYKEDVYQDYYIPKDSIIQANIWAMTRDTAKYKNPETFDPARFLDENGALTEDKVGFAFGFGRRICPGRHLSYDSVWLMMATILQTFDLRQKKDSLGEDIPLDIKYCDGVVCYPLPFDCTITPRSDKARQLIVDGYEKH